LARTPESLKAWPWPPESLKALQQGGKPGPLNAWPPDPKKAYLYRKAKKRRKRAILSLHFSQQESILLLKREKESQKHEHFTPK
jgi:hypothetical protein